MKPKLLIALLAAAVVVSAACLLLRNRKTEHPVARITRDGTVLEEINLAGVDKPRTLTFEDESGSNTVQVEKGRVRVSEADCPDQICVKQGWISDSTVPIVCLPHKFMVEIVGGGGKLDGGAG